MHPIEVTYTPGELFYFRERGSIVLMLIGMWRENGVYFYTVLKLHSAGVGLLGPGYHWLVEIGLLI